MAHNIEINNGVASFAENGRKERAWHKLGQVFDGPMTVKEALEASHADYQVGKQELFCMTPAIQAAMLEGKVDADLILDALIPNRKATMRLDKSKALGVVSDSYGVVQNEDAFKFIDTLVTGEISDSEHTPVIESAGVLGQGERIFITAKFPEQIILDNKGNDMVEMYVVFTTSHDGTGSVNCMVTPVRVVCNNTLNLAMYRNSGKLSLKHSANIMKRLDLAIKENSEFAYRALNMFDIYKKSLQEQFTHLQNIRLAEKKLNDILAEVVLGDDNFKVYSETGDIFHSDITVRGRNKFLAARDSIESGIGQDMGEKGTGMWLINGLTTYYQNNVKFKDEEMKFDSIQQGNVNKKIQKAFELITA